MNRTSSLASLALMVFGLPFAAGCAGEVAPEEENEALGQSASQLIGGDVATADQLDATLWIGNCTAARVGPRQILTAAHCVLQKNTATLKSQFTVGKTLSVTNDKTLSSASYTAPRTIERVQVHPSWITACRDGCPNNQALTAPFPADIAVITLSVGLPPGIATAPVATGRLANGASVTVTGYGCEQNIDTGSAARLKFERTFAMGHANDTLEGAYVFTRGKTADAEEASLCPGDSGGPLYRGTSTGVPAVVGVNAYYTFSDSSGVSTHNMHTRIGGNQHNVVGWLRNILPAESFVD